MSKKSSEDTHNSLRLGMNSRIFPFWILHNFKHYKLPLITETKGVDPCSVQRGAELRKYQEFVGKYLHPQTGYDQILLYHGLGSGKTVTAINVMNVLYNYNDNYNFIILIKASLRDDPWLKDLKIWLHMDGNPMASNEPSGYRNIQFVHFDSPYADRDFMNVIKHFDLSKPIMYIIDEVHNFIRNVYSNIVSTTGKRARVIYDYIIGEKRTREHTKIVLMSATPAINNPFELALLFNLLRPALFSSSELEFNKTFITNSVYPTLDPLKRNLFERRILGLVSYYTGATPDLYATQTLTYIDLPMSVYQYNVYRVFEEIESKIQKTARRSGKNASDLYRTYTRQAGNFVFPLVSSTVTGELRPRPYQFKINWKVAAAIEKGGHTNVTENLSHENTSHIDQYLAAIEQYLTKTYAYFQRVNESDIARGHTILTDLENFKKGYDTHYKQSFLQFYTQSGPKSELCTLLYNSSPKMLNIVFLTYISPGKVMVYTNYVIMEGIDMLKIYYQLMGFKNYKEALPYNGFCEYHGRIDRKTRTANKNMFNGSDNVYGSTCKVILISPSGTEGIQLLDIRQEHIMEPHWTEVRISQVIGRGIRQCSHKNLPMNERTVHVYRYKAIKPIALDKNDTVLETTDQYIENAAKARDSLIESFLSAMREVAVDCQLFRNHNMITQTYNCFSFPEEVVAEKNPGFAYKESMKEDVKYDSGSYAQNSTIERIKVIKIKAVQLLNGTTYSDPHYFWYYPKNGLVYDYTTHYPVGRVTITNNVPHKINANTYVIDTLFRIPTLYSPNSDPKIET